jgi:hypothetical protein
MRIASFCTLRIASGLQLAVLLSVVGYQVVRRLNSHGPETLLTRADAPSWLNSSIQAEPLSRQAQQELIQRHQLAKALFARASQMPAQVQSANPIPDLHVDPRLSGAFESDSLGKTFVVRKRQSHLL